MNSTEMSFCATCGQDPNYLVEFDTDTPKRSNRLEIAVAKIIELETKLAEMEIAKND
jgi:hypothetical protein